MTLSTAFLDELRARTTLSTLIQRTVPLKKAGREWKACCPFHQEKSPSFYVNDEKGMYHCFGCSAHGDAIRWMTEQRGLEFLDAVRELADAAGIEMPARDPRAVEREDRLDKARAVMERAALFYRECLLSAEMGREAREYLVGRGIGAAEIDTFGIGFAPPSRRGDRPHLASKLRDLPENALLELGLVKRRDDRPGGEVYDFFRNRIIIPIHDARGRVIGFGGRILGEGEPKYLNSPETPLFDKGRTLFNLHRAMPACRKTGRIVAVEGYMDVIAFARAGVADCVAPNGTALTISQLEELWRRAPMPILCFDGDRAGNAAALRAARLALPHLTPEKSLAFVFPPTGQDPDDVIREKGAAALSDMLAEERGAIDILWEQELASVRINTPEGRASLLDSVGKLAAQIQHRGLSLEYMREFKIRFEQLGRRSAPAAPPAPKAGRRGLNSAIEAGLLVGLMRHPDILAQDFEFISAINWGSDDAAGLADVLIDGAMHGVRTADDISILLESRGVAETARAARAAARVPFGFIAGAVTEASARELRDALTRMPRK
jgi:DNA primase